MEDAVEDVLLPYFHTRPSSVDLIALMLMLVCSACLVMIFWELDSSRTPRERLWCERMGRLLMGVEVDIVDVPRLLRDEK